MAKPTVVTFPTPEFKLPKFDLDALFATQTANLAAVHEAQSVLTGAAQAIAKVQYGYVEQAVAEAKAALATKELPKPEAVLANVKASGREDRRGRQGGRGPRGRRAEARLRGADPARPGQRRRAQGGRRLTPVSARRGGGPGISGHLISAVHSFDAERSRVPFLLPVGTGHTRPRASLLGAVLIRSIRPASGMAAGGTRCVRLGVMAAVPSAP